MHAPLPRFAPTITPLPFLRRVQDRFSRVTFAVCSVDGAPGQALLADLHRIDVLPTCVLFQGASEIDRVVGCTHKRPGKPVYDMLAKALLRAPSD